MKINDYILKDENQFNVITQAVYRIRRICNRANVILLNISGGKDSSLTFDLVMNEIKTRRQNVNRVEFDLNSYSYFELEPINNNDPFILCITIDPEIIYTETRNHLIFDKILPNGYGLYEYNGKIVNGFDPIKIDDCNCCYEYYNKNKDKFKTIEYQLPNNLNKIHNQITSYNNVVCIVPGEGIIHTFYKCLPIKFQNITSFGEDGFISWSQNEKNLWIQDKPTNIGCDIIDEFNWENKNIIPTSLLPKWLNFNTINVNGIECKQNFGLGSDLLQNPFFNKVNKQRICGWSFYGIKDEGDKYSEPYKFGQWLLQQLPKTIDNKETIIYSLVSIRADESFNRNTILKQADLYTGQYGYTEFN